LGLLTNLLSDLFGISTASVSKTFRTWICFFGQDFKRYASHLAIQAANI